LLEFRPLELSEHFGERIDGGLAAGALEKVDGEYAARRGVALPGRVRRALAPTRAHTGARGGGDFPAGKKEAPDDCAPFSRRRLRAAAGAPVGASRGELGFAVPSIA
jgi:hypothetical protein